MAAMSPLAGLMLLGFLVLVMVALLLWALLLPKPEAQERAEPRPQPEPQPPPPPTVAVTNDDVRGMKAAPRSHNVPDDAFERFLRAGRDDERD
jgi:hypothetical protein